MILYNKNKTQMSDERNKKVVAVLHQRQNDLTIVLENVNDPHNIAAVLRTCDAVGIMEIFVLNTTINTYKNFDTRKSSSANKWMIVHQYDDVQKCFDHVKKQYDRIFSTYLSDDAKDLYALDLSAPTAFVFGNERKGISAETLTHCDANFMIPQVGMIQSLNISVACAVTLYEAFRQKKNAQHYDKYKLNGAQEHKLLQHWDIKK
jgi:tRNA (guanosine-2'-O-)-methyltransferase